MCHALQTAQQYAAEHHVIPPTRVRNHQPPCCMEQRCCTYTQLPRLGTHTLRQSKGELLMRLLRPAAIRMDIHQIEGSGRLLNIPEPGAKEGFGVLCPGIGKRLS